MSGRGATGRGVLLLDDDPLVRGNLAELLRDEGYAAQEAADGAAALRVIDAGGIDLLVVDRGLGAGGNGFHVAAEAMQRHPELRVIYTTGLHAALRRRELGARERVLPKPFAASQLLALVRDLL